MIDRTDLWLPLLRRLTDEVAEWVVWKRADPAFSAPEDVDAVAPRHTWPAIEGVFTSWAREAGYAVVVCEHVPDTINLFALVEDGRSLLQLEVKDRTSFRGSVQFTAADLLAAAHLDPRGFRALRPGAEAALKLTLHGLRRGGLPAPAALREHEVVEGLREDPDGAHAVARASNMATRPLLRGIAAARAGGWDRAAMRRLELRAMLRAVATPRVAGERWWFRHVVRPRCPVLQTVYRDRRRIPGDVRDWLEVAARGHHVSAPGLATVSSAGRRQGHFVAIVGPDGVGKTTVARRLLESHDGPKAYVYFRPPLSGGVPTLPPEGPRPRGNKNPPPELQILGWLRLVKNLVWFWVGYVRTVRPVVRRGGLVVADRWGYGYVVQPGPLRFFGPAGLARRAVRLLPRPHLVANLTAPPDTVVGRKDELTAAEVEHELRLWSGLNVPHLQTFDATGPAEDTAAAIQRALQGSAG